MKSIIASSPGSRLAITLLIGNPLEEIVYSTRFSALVILNEPKETIRNVEDQDQLLDVGWMRQYLQRV